MVVFRSSCGQDGCSFQGFNTVYDLTIGSKYASFAFAVQARRLYVVTVQGPLGTDEEQSVKDFIDSFHILGARNR